MKKQARKLPGARNSCGKKTGYLKGRLFKRNRKAPAHEWNTGAEERICPPPWLTRVLKNQKKTTKKTSNGMENEDEQKRSSRDPVLEMKLL
jgi:hypothetical protein